MGKCGGPDQTEWLFARDAGEGQLTSESRPIFGRRDMQIIRRISGWLLLISLFITSTISVSITLIELNLNRNGTYCDKYSAGMIYIEEHECFVNILNIVDIFARSMMVYFIFCSLILFTIFSIGLLLYMARDRRHLGGID